MYAVAILHIQQEKHILYTRLHSRSVFRQIYLCVL